MSQVDEFLSLSLAGKSPRGAKKAYRAALRHFQDYLSKKKIEEADPTDIRGFLAHGEKNHNWSLSTMKLYALALSRFFRYIGKYEKEVMEIARQVPNPTARKFVYIDGRDFNSFLNASSDDRDHMLLELALATGLRLSEFLGISPQDIDFQTRSIQILGKGRKVRTVFFDPKTGKDLQEYIEKHSIKHDQPLFDVSPRTVEYLVRRTAKKAGLKNWKKLTPHSLRHSFAIYFLRRGGDIESLRRLLGHSTLAMTHRYLDFTMDVVKEKYDQVFGVS